MATEWFYTAKGQKNGPISPEELRRLAQEGRVLPTDMLWKEGMKDWRPASEARKLFEGVSIADAGSEKTIGTKTEPTSASVEAPHSSKVAVSLGARMQNAARATGLKAEQTKLTAVSLPAAYIKLGKHLHSNRLLMEKFPDLYQQIDALQAKAAEASQTAAEATGVSLREKAKALAQKGAELAKSKAAEVQQLAVFKRLGEAACEGGTADSIEAERLVDILAIRKRVAAINETLMANSTAAPGSLEPAPSVKGEGKANWPWKRRLKWVGGSLAALYLVGLVFGTRNEDEHQTNAALQGQQTPSSATVGETADPAHVVNAATSPHGQDDPTSSEYLVNKYLREMNEGHAEAQRENEARWTQMREEEKRFIQKEEAEAREQAANSMREYEEKQAVLERQQREEQAVRERQQKEEQAKVDAMRKPPPPQSAVAAAPPRAKRTSTATSSKKDEDDPIYQEGYQYASSILQSAANAPAQQKRDIMKQLEPASVGKKPRAFLRGCAEAMKDFEVRMANEVLR